jgi:hypothetical protein
MIRRLAGLLVLCALGAVVVLAGCAKNRIVSVGNLPPETTLFVQGTLDTVNHVVRIYWFGSDPDGEVSGFELRFLNPSAPADTGWVFTTRTDSTFTVFTPAGFAAPRFEVRAVDDAGQRDPSPALADFQFTNQPPTARFTQRLLPNDTTYASVTLAWTADDPDGDAAAMRFLVGLDTVPSALQLVAGNGVTLDTAAFKIGGVYPTTRPRMAFLRAIDDGGRASGWDSLRWVVRAPSAPGTHPRLLLIDDVPSSNPANLTIDTLWSNTAARNLPAGSFSILRLDTTQPFRSNQDVIQTFRLFDAVIWYRGTQTGFSTLLEAYQDGFAAYLDGGGKMLIESLNLIEGENAGGPLRNDWVTRYLGSRGLIRAYRGDAFGDSGVSWSITPGFTDTVGGVPVARPVILRSTSLSTPDSLRNGANNNGLRGFDVIDTSQVILWARDSTLSPRVARSIPVAVSVPVAGSPAGAGRMVAITLPVRGANLFFTAPRFLAKVFQQLGLTGP